MRIEDARRNVQEGACRCARIATRQQGKRNEGMGVQECKEESKECKIERARRGLQMCKECTEENLTKEGNENLEVVQEVQGENGKEKNAKKCVQIVSA